MNGINVQSNKAAFTYGEEGIPDSFLIDSTGIIIARDLRGKQLDKKLEELFN